MKNKNPSEKLMAAAEPSSYVDKNVYEIFKKIIEEKNVGTVG